MKYYQAKFTISPLTQDAADILAAMAAEAGFEAFEESEQGITGYVQQELFDRDVLDVMLQQFPMSDTHIIYEIEEADDKDWNEAWEQEGFSPIVVGNGRLVIHDGKHLPEASAQAMQIEINAQQAFGTGTHETTQMMCGWLASMSLQGLKVLDAGCGTGILGIVALKLGSNHVTAYDIDEWSRNNAQHNAQQNGVGERITVYCGDATLLDSEPHDYDLVVANINRNILLQDMDRFRKVMKPQGTLILSGFYTEDIPLLAEKGQQLGLIVEEQKEQNHWASMVLRGK